MSFIPNSRRFAKALRVTFAFALLATVAVQFGDAGASPASAASCQTPPSNEQFYKSTVSPRVYEVFSTSSGLKAYYLTSFSPFCTHPKVITTKYVPGSGNSCSGSHVVYFPSDKKKLYYVFPDGYSFHLTPAKYADLGKPKAIPASQAC